jgi:hypothetical protein
VGLTIASRTGDHLGPALRQRELHSWTVLLAAGCQPNEGSREVRATGGQQSVHHLSRGGY